MIAANTLNLLCTALRQAPFPLAEAELRRFISRLIIIINENHPALSSCSSVYLLAHPKFSTQKCLVSSRTNQN